MKRTALAVAVFLAVAVLAVLAGPCVLSPVEPAPDEAEPSAAAKPDVGAPAEPSTGSTGLASDDSSTS